MKSVKQIVKLLLAFHRKKNIVPVITPVDKEKLLFDKVAFITGGNSGIGLTIAQKLLESGAKVVIAGSNAEKNIKAIDYLSSNNVASVIVDYSKPDTFSSVVSDVISKYGRIDFFVNSSGVHSVNIDFMNMTPEEYDRVLNINLKGAYFMTQKVVKHMIAQSIKGHVIFISSSRGSEPAWSPYGLSKWGLNGLTKGLAQMLNSNGIIFNCIAPGPTATALLGIQEGDSIYTTDVRCGRLCTPIEVANLAVFLLGETGNMITGETIHISGGRGVWDIR